MICQTIMASYRKCPLNTNIRNVLTLMKHEVRVTHARPRMNQPIINLKINSPEFSKTLTRLRSTAVLYCNRGGNKCPELLRMGKTTYHDNQFLYNF